LSIFTISGLLCRGLNGISSNVSVLLAGTIIIYVSVCFAVVSSNSEPVAGWVDNWNGPTGLIAAAGKGFFRTMWGNPNATADFVPVDIVINLMIVAAWRTATDR